MSKLKNQHLVYIGIIILVLHFKKLFCKKLNKRSNYFACISLQEISLWHIVMSSEKIFLYLNILPTYVGQFELKWSFKVDKCVWARKFYNRQLLQRFGQSWSRCIWQSHWLIENVNTSQFYCSTRHMGRKSISWSARQARWLLHLFIFLLDGDFYLFKKLIDSRLKSCSLPQT